MNPFLTSGPLFDIKRRAPTELSYHQVASYNSVSIVKSVLQTQLVQPNAIYEDEGWYRCVAKNSQGYVYKDTYLTVAASQGTFILFLTFKFLKGWQLGKRATDS